MLQRLLKRFSSDLAVDLGTAATRVAVVGEGVVLDEPSVVAVEPGARRVLARGCAVGHLARQIEGRTSDSISVVRPIREGVIADFDLCEAMLRYLMRKAQPSGLRLPPRVLVGLPGGVTPVERRAVFNSVGRAGARQVWGLPKATAAAIGAGLPIGEPLASMICDLGAGTIEIAVLSLGEVVSARSIRTGGDAFDQALADALRREHQLRVGLPSIERIRREIGTALADGEPREAEIAGVDAATGLPRRMTVSSQQIHQALAAPLLKLVEAAGEVIDGCPAELAADLAERGVTLCGAAARLHDLDRCLSRATGVPVRLAAEPQTATIRGLLVCAEQLDAWKPALISSDDDE